MSWHTLLSGAVAVGSLVAMVIASGVACAADAQPQGRKVSGGELGIEATIYEAGPINSDQVKSADHMPYGRGMICAECHDVTFDLMTTSTKQFTNNFPQLPNDEIWAKIEAFLPGRERFALTTAYEGMPTASTVDMVLDKQNKVFFVVAEKGTEKLLHLEQNPNVSAVRFEGWTVAEGGKREWRSAQIKATTEIIAADDPRFDEFLDTYNLVRMGKERARLRFDLIRVTPTEIYYFDTALGAEDMSIYQRWQRD